MAMSAVWRRDFFEGLYHISLLVKFRFQLVWVSQTSVIAALLHNATIAGHAHVLHVPVVWAQHLCMVITEAICVSARLTQHVPKFIGGDRVSVFMWPPCNEMSACANSCGNHWQVALPTAILEHNSSMFDQIWNFRP